MNARLIDAPRGPLATPTDRLASALSGLTALALADGGTLLIDPADGLCLGVVVPFSRYAGRPTIAAPEMAPVDLPTVRVIPEPPEEEPAEDGPEAPDAVDLALAVARRESPAVPKPAPNGEGNHAGGRPSSVDLPAFKRIVKDNRGASVEAIAILYEEKTGAPIGVQAVKYHRRKLALAGHLD